MTTAPGLAEVARQVTAGEATPPHLSDVLLASTVFCQTPRQPGQAPVACR